MPPPPPSPSPPLGAPPPSSLRWIVTAVLAASLVGFGDVLLAAARAPVSTPARVLGSCLVAAAGLYGLPALVLGLLQGLWLQSLPGGFDRQRPRRVLALLRGDEALDLRLTRLALCSGVVLAMLTGILYHFGRTVAMEMANKRNSALSLALFAPVALLLAALLVVPLWRPSRRLALLLPRPRLLYTLGAAALGAGLVALLAVLSVDWRALRFGPVKAALSLVLLQGLFLWLRVGYRLGQPFGPRPALALGLFAAGILGFLSSVGYTYGAFGPSLRFGEDPRARALLGEETAGAGDLLRGARRFFDRDRDGFAANLGGGDCDDHRADTHPGAEDPPGDGVDQDCEGGDAPVAAAPAEAPAGERPTGDDGGSGPVPRWKGNFLLIAIDTLRADRLDPRLAPRMAALADKAFRFRNVYAQAPNTPRSFPSILTSRLPSQIHFTKRTLNYAPLTGQDETLFTALHKAGYRNYGVFSHFYMEEKIGLARGFAEWKNDGAKTIRDSNSDIAAPRIAARVVERLRALGKERGQRPFALWTHLFDPHSTYMDHAEFPVGGKGLKYFPARYDAEVSFTDRHVGQILDALKEAGLAEDTAVVIFSDHGEAFGEHRLGSEPLYYHGEALYDEVLRVPLVIYVPGAGPRDVTERVMLLDLAPTLLELAEVARPAGFMGRSLVPLLRGGTLGPRPVFAEMLPCTSFMHNQRVVVSGDYKLYAKFTENTTELYNLKEDPTEQRNLVHSDPERARALKALLAQPAAAAVRVEGPAAAGGEGEGAGG